jgi:predicted RND superfamily exporter protein
MDKKILIKYVLPITIILVIFILFVYFNYQSSEVGITNNFKNLATSNSWATADDYTTLKDNKNSILFSYRSIRIGAIHKMDLMGLDSTAESDKFTEISKEIDAQNFKTGYKLTNEEVSKINDLTKVTNADLNKIKSSLPKSINELAVDNYQIQEDWAVVSLSNTKGGQDGLFAFLHKENNKWMVKLGPGSAFEDDDMANAGVPLELINAYINGFPLSEEVYN